MSDLKPCPFCGGGAHFIKVKHVVGVWYTVCCDDAECFGHEQSRLYTLRRLAAEAWNRRAERTCRMEWRDNGDGYPPSVRCSACGGWLDAVADVEDVAQFEFCPMCGARVIG